MKISEFLVDGHDEFTPTLAPKIRTDIDDSTYYLPERYPSKYVKDTTSEGFEYRAYIGITAGPYRDGVLPDFDGVLAIAFLFKDTFDATSSVPGCVLYWVDTWLILRVTQTGDGMTQFLVTRGVEEMILDTVFGFDKRPLKECFIWCNITKKLEPLRDDRLYIIPAWSRIKDNPSERPGLVDTSPWAEYPGYTTLRRLMMSSRSCYEDYHGDHRYVKKFVTSLTQKRVPSLVTLTLRRLPPSEIAAAVAEKRLIDVDWGSRREEV